MSIYTAIPGSVDIVGIENSVNQNTEDINSVIDEFSGVNVNRVKNNTDINKIENNKLADYLMGLIDKTEQKIIAPDAQNGDSFGHSVSIDGNYCIVSAYFEDAGGSSAGAAYIFHRTGINTWDAGTKIMASDAENDDNFGFSVSISGDYCVVGSPYEDTGGSNAGAAYIFHRTGTNTWDAGTKIIASDIAANDWFGFSVSISGDYCVVGAYGKDTAKDGVGAAYIFHRTGTNTWDAGTKIVASDANSWDKFGWSVSIDGDYCAVSATGADSVGAVYIFHRTGINTWDAGTKIMISSPANDHFGDNILISGDYCIVGAHREDTGGTDAGAAYIFHRTGTNTWDAGVKIIAPDAEAGDYFGYSVSISGDCCVVGAEAEGGSLTGAAYIFHRTGTNSWDAGTKIVASDAEASDWLGYSVSIDGDYCVVGATGEDTGGSNAGAAYIYKVPLYI